MLQPENQSKKYDALFADIDTGRIKLPMFQRDFVWTKEQTAKLIDSIIKGFPIGTFIVWKTREELRSMRNIGNVLLPEAPKGDAVSYVLDGQQRITSLYAVRKGIILTKDEQEIDYSQISIDLSIDPDSDDRAVVVDPPEGVPSIPVHKLLNGSVLELVKDYMDHLEKIEIYRKRLTGYDFSVIVIPDYPIDVACEVFTRINTGGTELTLFEIMIAKTYDVEKDFDLSREYELLLDSKDNGKDLEDAHFNTIPSITVLHCMAAYIVKRIKRGDILKLKKHQFIEMWSVVKDGIFTAVDYFRSHFRIPVSHLMPYDALLIPFTYFFIHKKGKQPTAKQEKLLTQYFWWASLSSRFSSGMENKVAQDIERMDQILKGEAPDYRGEELQLTLDNLLWRWFSPGDAFCKAILCLYAFHQPRSFSNDHLVKIDNSWLKTANSVNYHHFFPRSYLEKKGYKNWEANCVLNITIVDDYLNKRTIGAKPPSDYMKTFKKNKNLADTMRTHLINDLDGYGIWKNKYETFLEERGKVVLQELQTRLEPGLDD
ncbi:MAG TPA: DUF262 domain-containing protein [Anaerolineales bacterium]|nr:DUF262 domain-containing protein [Anaerolineales bacterium]HLO33342.1 DUF262 domain-containing protein [Anaerolineales bacterium]